MKVILKILFIAITLIYISGCSKLNNDIPPAPVVSVHKEGIIDKESPNFHGDLVREFQWDMRKCQQCHGSNYGGGLVNVSCLNCHRNANGPEACNTCHGEFRNVDRIAPPRDINENTTTDSVGVGAHVKHLYDNQVGSQIPCFSCHNVPPAVFVSGHVDSDLPAEVIFSGLANHDGGANADYNYSSATCSEVYCHGSFSFSKSSSNFQFIYTEDAITGNSFSTVWNQVDGTQAQCGTCHSLPPEGHRSESGDQICAYCHWTVVDLEGNIIDQTKHINGEINVFDN